MTNVTMVRNVGDDVSDFLFLRKDTGEKFARVNWNASLAMWNVHEIHIAWHNDTNSEILAIFRHWCEALEFVHKILEDHIEMEEYKKNKRQ